MLEVNNKAYFLSISNGPNNSYAKPALTYSQQTDQRHLFDISAKERQLKIMIFKWLVDCMRYKAVWSRS